MKTRDGYEAVKGMKLERYDDRDNVIQITDFFCGDVEYDTLQWNVNKEDFEIIGHGHMAESELDKWIYE